MISERDQTLLRKAVERLEHPFERSMAERVLEDLLELVEEAEWERRKRELEEEERSDQ